MLIAKKERESEALELEEAACVDIFGTALSSSPTTSSQSSDVFLEGVSNDLIKEVTRGLLCFACEELKFEWQFFQEIELQTINDARPEPNSDDEVQAERPKNLTNEEIFEKLLSLLKATTVFTQQFVKNIEVDSQIEVI